MFLNLLEKTIAQGRYVSDSKNSDRFAPKVFARWPNGERYSRKEFEATMDQLFNADVITVKTVGGSGHQHREIVHSESALL